jgi:plastocyanin
MRNVRLLWRSLSLALAIFLSAAIMAPGIAHAASYTITITGTQFVPGTLTAAVGDTITFINNTTATQSAKTAVASGFNTGDIGPSMSKLVTLVNEGTFTYSSLYTPSLTGVVTVTAATTSLTTTETSTTSTAMTTTVSTTQPQPVSGAAENLMILLVVGSAFLTAGSYMQWRREPAHSVIVDMPLVSSNQGKDASTTTPDQHT